jgi:hypothetical protein
MHSASDRHSNALARYLLAAALIKDLHLDVPNEPIPSKIADLLQKVAGGLFY